MNVRYRVELSQTERATYGPSERRQARGTQAQASADFAGGRPRASDGAIARSVGVGGSTIYRTKRRFVLGNLAGCYEVVYLLILHVRAIRPNANERAAEL
jgi:hypothetical protein